MKFVCMNEMSYRIARLHHTAQLIERRGEGDIVCVIGARRGSVAADEAAAAAAARKGHAMHIGVVGLNQRLCAREMLLLLLWLRGAK